MPKIAFIHTADLHLETEKPDHLEVLKWILAKARGCKAAVLISGDLFNSEQDAYTLESTVSGIFAEYNDITVFIIPGNHDTDAFAKGTEYRDNIKLLRVSPYTEMRYEGINIIGVPHRRGSCLMNEIENLKCSGLSVLLVHGTFFDDSAQCVRDELQINGEDSFPVFAEDIVDKNIIYTAMGHFHANFTIIENNKRKICYPGSPISMDDTELGVRKVAKVVIDTDSKELEISECPVEIGIYMVRNKFTVFPGSEGRVLKILMKYLSENINERADVELELNGFTKADTLRLNHAVDSIIAKYNDKFFSLKIINNTTGYQDLLDKHIITSDFISRLEDYNIDNIVKNRVVDLSIKAFNSTLS
ncbi:MAG: metallophosphoesterase family protein [Candidatus Anammoxibacter sp.]